MYQATLTRQGQITVPVEIRNMLGLVAGDKLVFLKDNNRVIVNKDGGLEELRGVFAEYASGKAKFTPARLKKIRSEMWTERYRKYLKQNEKGNS